jgi:hypothetical protein
MVLPVPVGVVAQHLRQRSLGSCMHCSRSSLGANQALVLGPMAALSVGVRHCPPVTAIPHTM